MHGECLCSHVEYRDTWQYSKTLPMPLLALSKTGRFFFKYRNDCGC